MKRIVLFTMGASLLLLASWWVGLKNTDFSSIEQPFPKQPAGSPVDLSVTSCSESASNDELNALGVYTNFSSNNHPAFIHPAFIAIDDDRLSYSEIVNALTLMTTLIDLRTERVVYFARFDRHRADFRFSDNFEICGLSRSDIKRHIDQLLHKNKSRRDKEIKYFDTDLASVRGQVRSLSKKPHIDPTPPGWYDNDFIPLKDDEQMIQAIFSSHFKAILYEEVELLLFERAKSYNNRYLKEIKDFD